MDTPSFVIVTFVNEDDAPGIVASNWINPHGNTCYYPNVRTEEMKNKLLRKRADPEESWPQYQIKILKRYGMSFILLHKLFKNYINFWVSLLSNFI